MSFFYGITTSLIETGAHNIALPSSSIIGKRWHNTQPKLLVGPSRVAKTKLSLRLGQHVLFKSLY